MGNAVTLVAKQVQIVWIVFGVFWEANAVWLVALFQSGDPPKRPVGLIVSRVGVALSPVGKPIATMVSLENADLATVSLNTNRRLGVD